MDTFDRILNSFPGLGVERKLPCICQGDDPDVQRCEYLFAYEDVVRRREKGKVTIECNFSLSEVSLNRLLYGIHESSQDEIREQVERITAQPEEHYRQVILLGERGVIHNYNRLESIDSRCPNTFMLSRSDGKRLAIQLLCQSADGWHFSSRAASYEVSDTDETRAMLAPLLFETMPLLAHVVPLSGMDVNLQTNVPRMERMKLHSNVRFVREMVG